MARFDLVFQARRVIVAGSEVARCVAVRDGTIAAVEPLERDLTGDRTVRLGSDVVLLPGLVDTHVHVNEPGRTQWEGFATATRAAAAGGVTTLLDMPLNSLPPTCTTAALAVKRAAARGQCHVDVGFWGGAIPGNLADLADLYDEGVFGFKCFMVDSGVAEFPSLTPGELTGYLRRLAGLDALMIVHAEDPDRLDPAGAPASRRYQDFLGSRPRDAENTAVARLIEAAGTTGCRVHVLHLSSSDALGPLARARRTGTRITVETCPHYLFFAAEEVADGSTQFKCCPPIREAENRERLWDGLVAGVIDSVVSDHSPCTEDLKCLDTGDFGHAWGGISSLQLGLRAVWTQARQRGLPLTDVVRWMAEAPARIAGLADRGRIEPGLRADFCVFAPDDDQVVELSELHHRNPVTPYAGLALAGTVRGSWLRGAPVTGETPGGRLIRRNPVDRTGRGTR